MFPLSNISGVKVQSHIKWKYSRYKYFKIALNLFHPTYVLYLSQITFHPCCREHSIHVVVALLDHLVVLQDNNNCTLPPTGGFIRLYYVYDLGFISLYVISMIRD